MSGISAVIITKNEASNIKRCILSLLPVVDEVLISDSLSSDDTVQIARLLGARVIERAFEGYGATKNFANSQASHSWILSIDADEELDPTLQQSLLSLKKELSDHHKNVYVFQRLNNYCGAWIKHGGWYPDKKVRLFPKHIMWNLAEVHEVLVIPSTYQTSLLTGKLLHYSYNSIESHLQKIERYSSRGAEEAYKRGKKAGFVKLYLSPLFRFVRDYIIKLGFMDGRYGFTIARLTAKEVYLKYHKLSQMYRAKI